MLPAYLNPYVLAASAVLVLLAFLGGWLWGSERAHATAVKAQQAAVTAAVEATKKAVKVQHDAAIKSAVAAQKAEDARHVRVKIVRKEVVKFVPTASVCDLPPEVIQAINQAGH